jgi:hypothetical protein
MLRQLTAFQLAEMIAHTRIEAMPVTEEEAAKANTAKLKARFACMVPIK